MGITHSTAERLEAWDRIERAAVTAAALALQRSLPLEVDGRTLQLGSATLRVAARNAIEAYLAGRRSALAHERASGELP